MSFNPAYRGRHASFKECQILACCEGWDDSFPAQLRCVDRRGLDFCRDLP